MKPPQPRYSPPTRPRQPYPPGIYYTRPNSPKPKRKLPNWFWVLIGFIVFATLAVILAPKDNASTTSRTAETTRPTQNRTPVQVVTTAPTAAAQSFNPADCHNVSDFEAQYNGNYDKLDGQTVCLEGIANDVHIWQPSNDLTFSFRRMDLTNSNQNYSAKLDIIDRRKFDEQFILQLNGKRIRVQATLHKDYMPGFYIMPIDTPSQLEVISS